MPYTRQAHNALLLPVLCFIIGVLTLVAVVGVVPVAAVVAVVAVVGVVVYGIQPLSTCPPPAASTFPVEHALN